MPSLWEIKMCKWLLVYIAYFILYREYGQLGELNLIWTLSHDYFKGFFLIEESQEITSSMPSLHEIKIYSCANNYWSTMHTSSCIENMDNLVNYSIWTLSHDCFKGFFLNWRVSRDKFIYAIIVWSQNIFTCKCKLVNIAYFILYGEYETCLDVKLRILLVKLIVVYERDIDVGIS